MSLLTCEDIIAAIPQVYQKGHGDGEKQPPENTGYTFPPGTEYNDIVALVGDDRVTDKTVDKYIKKVVTKNQAGQPSPNFTLYIYVVDAVTGEQIGQSLFDTFFGYADYMHSELTINNSATGAYTVSVTYDQVYRGEQTQTLTGTSTALIGFGASGNTFSVKG